MLRWIFRFDPAIVFLVLACLYFSTVGSMSMAQNAKPIADAGMDQEVDSGAMVRLDGRGSSARDGGTIVSYHWTRTGGSSGNTLELTGADTARPTFTADRLFPGTADLTHEFTLTVKDDHGATSTDIVTVTINSPNAIPVAFAGDDRTVVSGATVTLDGSASSDNDGMVASYRWRRTGGTGNSGVVLTGANTARLRFTADTLAADVDAVTHVFELVVIDDEDAESVADMVTVTVTAGNAPPPPVADAGGVSTHNSAGGVLTVASGAMVRLDGRGSSAREGGTIRSYHWARTGGSGDRTIVLTGADTAQPTFTAETLAPDSPDRTHVFTLTVTDDKGATSTDRVWVLVSSPIGIPLHCHHHNPIGYPVSPPNMRPVADAGPDHTVSRPMTVILDGSGSYDPDGTIVAYQWYQWTSDDRDLLPRGGGNSSTPRLTLKVAPPLPGKDDWIQYFCLVVWDNLGVKSWGDAVTITATSRTNADAGPDQTVASGALVMLDGSGSTADPRRTIASYGWVRTSGDATATLSGADTATPSFTAETLVDGAADATHVFTLTVTDSAGGTDTDTVTITVTSEFADPVAEAGDPQSVRAGATVTLDGSGSTVDDRRTITSYSWTRTGGTSSVTGTLTGETTAKPSFTAEARDAGAPAVTHILTLTVTDSGGDTDTDTVTITVNAGLVAEAGEAQTVASGATVMLDGSGSTASDSSRTVTYAWTRTDGTGDSSVTLTNANMLQPTFTADTLALGATAVTQIFTLTVTDNAGSTEATDTVTITVNAGLVAEAGEAQSVGSGATVMLDGSGSTASDSSRTVTYAWTRTDGTGDSSVTLTNANTLQPTFTADTLALGATAVTQIFTLTVTDNAGSTEATDTVTITVNAGLVAEAGEAQSVGSGATVMLDGSGSTASDSSRTVTYAWTRTDGTGVSSVTLTNANMLQPTFTADTLALGATAVTQIFTLTVTDNAGSTEATDTVTITVNAGLVAEAGEAQSVGSGATVMLDGSGSTASDSSRTVTYAWTRTDGTGVSSVTLTNANTLQPTFTADTLALGGTAVTQIFTLTVTDNAGSTEATDTVTITVNAPLVAEAGEAQSVGSGATVMLDGSGSTASDSSRTVTYAWTRTDGTGDSSVTLTNANMLQPTFTADTLALGATAVTQIFTLTVTDNTGSTEATDTVTITVNAGLVAEAGEAQSVGSGATVMLDGSGSTASDSSRTVTYAWTRTDGTGVSSVTLTNANTLQPTFTADTLALGATAVTQIFTLTVTDNAGSTEATDTVTITVNAGLVAEAGEAQSVGSGATVMLDGSGSTASDSSRTVTYAWTRTDGTGVSSVTLTNANTLQPTFTADTLALGATAVTQIFTLTVTDNAGSTEATDTVTITVNAPLVAEAGEAQSVGSGATVMLDGSGSTASDSSRTVTYAWTRTDGTGDSSVTLTNANMLQPTFTADTLALGATAVTQIFTLTVTDNAGSTEATDTVTITVNAGLVAEAGEAQSVGSGATVMLDGSGSTASDSSRTVTYAWTRTDGTGDSSVTLTNANTLQPTFTADTLALGATAVTQIFTLTVTDNAGSTEATDTVTITVNAPLVAEAGEAQSVGSGATVMLDGSGSTASDSSRTVTYAWTRTDGTGDSSVTLTNANMLQPTFTADTLALGATAVTQIFTLTVTDNAGSTEATDTVTITVNAGLVAEAGEAQSVGSGATVMLDGSGSTASDSSRTVTYAWTRTDGTGDSSVTLTNANTLQPTFTADTLALGATAVTQIFTLTVTDNAGSTEATDTVTITVNAPLVAEAGEAQSVGSGATVMLDGSGSTASDSSRTVTYAWTRTDGTGDSSVTLTNANMLQPTFTADTLALGATAVTQIFTLTVTDNAGSTEATDTVTITVNAGLVAEAGEAQSVGSGATVMLDGSGSTASDSSRTVTYAWTRTDGTGVSSVTLTNANTLQPTFTADTLALGATAVTQIFTLTVTDNAGSTEATDTVTITVNAPLVAEAGEAQSVGSGATVMLDGSGSTASDSSRTVTYAWTRTDGTGDSSVTLTNANMLQPTFTADTLALGATAVTQIFTLTVTDNAGSTEATDTVTITVNAPLVAEAGEAQSVGSGATVMLDGSGSTASDSSRTVTYAWTRTDGTGVSSVTLTNANTLQPTFTADTLVLGGTAVTQIFTLTVTDNAGSTEATDTVTITVNAPLVAEAGEAQSVGSGATVMLDGSGSTASDSSRTVTYAWTRTDGTGDSSVTLTNANMLQPTFMADTLALGATAVTQIFTLTVTDNTGSTEATDTVTITVNAPLVAEAGEAQSVGSGATVMLDGSGSTASDSSRTVTYAWTRTDGTGDSSVTLTNANTLQPTFTADTLALGATAVTQIFTLTVTDNAGSTEATDTVTITVKAPPFGNLVAQAGPDQDNVASGTKVTLDGSGSTPTGSGRVVTYSWARTGGTTGGTVTLTDATTLAPSFTADTLNPGDDDVEHIITLTVTDDAGSTDATDTVTITVKAPPFGNLVAQAGPDQDNVASGTKVTLDGSGSTPTGSGRVVTYSWARTGGTTGGTVTLADDTTLAPSFTADTLNPGDDDVEHIITLTVTDDAGSTDATDTVTITVKAPPFGNLVAQAGPDQDNVGSGTKVTLDGSGSTPTGSGRVVTYSWARTGGTTGGTVTLTDATTLAPSFTADTLNPGDDDVEHIITLTVTDNKGSTEATDMVTITVNAIPMANAGPDREVVSGTLVSLDGSGSTGGMIEFKWKRMGGTGDSNMTLSGMDTRHPSFKADELKPEANSVTHIFSLVVTSDEGMKSKADTVTITVTSGFADPVAKVVSGSEEITVDSGAEVQLDGSGSTVDRRRKASYAWTRVSGTGDSALVLIGANTKQLSFKADTLKHDAKDVTHVIKLTVTDDAGNSDTATVTVKVVAVAQVEVDILVSHSELTVQEGDSSAYQVKLSKSPRREVDVIAHSDNENIVLENAQLTFNANNWDAWQEVKISTVSDPDKEDDKALIQHRLVAERVTLGQSGIVIVTVREEDPVLRPIGEYLAARITALFNKQRKLIPFLKRDGSIPGGSNEFSFNATNGRMALDGRFVRDGIWGEITGSYTRSDFGDTKSVLGSFGLHWKNSERFLAGVMLQFDLSENDLAAGTGSIDGAGWLAGPYFAAGYDAHPIYIEGRLLYGQSDNDFWLNDPNLGKRSGSFNTRRLFAQLRMEGEIALSDEDYGPRLIPYADARWLKEHAKGFTDSLDKRVPGQKVGIGHLEFGSNVEIPIATTRGAMTFIGGLGVIYSDTEADYIRLESRGRGRGEMGFSYDRDDKVRIDFQSFYDGIGSSEYENYGLSLRAEMKF